MDRRAFITATGAAAVGLASNPILTARAQGKEVRPTSVGGSSRPRPRVSSGHDLSDDRPLTRFVATARLRPN